MYGHTYSKSMDQPGMVASPARGQLNRENYYFPVPRQPAHPHTQAESGAYLRDSSRIPRRRPYIYLKPPYAIGSVPSLSGHAIAYRWRSLPRVCRHRASKPPGSSERVLSWQVTTDQLIYASLSHTHYWYEVGMLKVSVCIVLYQPKEPFARVHTETDLNTAVSLGVHSLDVSTPTLTPPNRKLLIALCRRQKYSLRQPLHHTHAVADVT